ncbi:MAG: PIN domain-containing protein [Chitinispirillales bacterium]|nr:PIN domain-containing protein [Chitinispirillales bacterium]
MLLYLDNCCFNRPFDDQSHLQISLETQAKLFIQQEILYGKYELMWSYVLEYENSKNPFDARRDSVIRWKKIAKSSIVESEEILSFGEKLIERGIKLYDALHVACAYAGGCDCLLTVDRGLLNKQIDEIQVYSPIDFIMELEV